MSHSEKVQRRPLVVANWKLNGWRADGVTLATTLAERYGQLLAPAFDMVLCPPATLVDAVARAVDGSGVLTGGQDASAHRKGAYTGEVSAWGLADLGARYVIVGHSERRQHHHETDALVRAKATAALAAGLTPIICVGENVEAHQSGRTLAVVAEQIAGSLPGGVTAAEIVIAYEPLWAIGSGAVATLAGIEAVHQVIRADVSLVLGSDGGALRVLYGGSVKPDNAHPILSLDDVDGVLVGGASLKADDFWDIALAAG